MVLEPPPYRRVEQAVVIGDGDRQPSLSAGVQILQQRVHYALEFAKFVRIVAHFRQGIELVEDQDTLITVSEVKQIGDVTGGGPEKRAYQAINPRVEHRQPQTRCQPEGCQGLARAGRAIKQARA